jgi:hypothetical protein
MLAGPWIGPTPKPIGSLSGGQTSHHGLTLSNVIKLLLPCTIAAHRNNFSLRKAAK